MNNRSRMIIRALEVSRKYKLTDFDKLMIVLLKGNTRGYFYETILQTQIPNDCPCCMEILQTGHGKI